jgi:hypothetical protein
MRRMWPETAQLAEGIVGATARGNVITVDTAVGLVAKLPRDYVALNPKKGRGLKAAAGGDIAWTVQRRSDLTEEGVYLKRASERLRHDLKKFYKGETK